MAQMRRHSIRMIRQSEPATHLAQVNRGFAKAKLGRDAIRIDGGQFFALGWRLASKCGPRLIEKSGKIKAGVGFAFKIPGSQSLIRNFDSSRMQFFHNSQIIERYGRQRRCRLLLARGRKEIVKQRRKIHFGAAGYGNLPPFLTDADSIARRLKMDALCGKNFNLCPCISAMRMLHRTIVTNNVY